VEDVYQGSKDSYKNFVLRMVLAIAMQKLDTQYAGLADSYYLASLPYLEAVTQPMDLKTLQCFVLISQYSLVTPSRTAVYYIVGLATRLCQQLGLCQEKTMSKGSEGLDFIEKDMRRRLSWISVSMEYGLSHILGRPSAFAVGEGSHDVKYFETIDDQFITRDRILPGPPSAKKKIAVSKNINLIGLCTDIL
jgi:Fungal specific transcription factor domain